MVFFFFFVFFFVNFIYSLSELDQGYIVDSMMECKTICTFLPQATFSGAEEAGPIHKEK